MTAKIVAPAPGLLKLIDVPGKGRGVFAGKRIAHGTLICADPVIRMTRTDRPQRSSILAQYPFRWVDGPYVEAFALGYVGLLNHSKDPNCWVDIAIKDNVIRIYADADIKRGEELTYDYGVEPWFDVAN